MREAHRIRTVVSSRGAAIVVALLLFSGGAAGVRGAEPPGAPPNDARVEGVPSLDRGTQADFAAHSDWALWREALPPFRRQDGAMVCDAAWRVPRARTQSFTCEAPPAGVGPWGPASLTAGMDPSRPTDSGGLASFSGLRGDSVIGAGAPMVPPIAGPPIWRVVDDVSSPYGFIEGPNLVYDAARGRVFHSDSDVFWGVSRREGLAWEWDGRAWVQIRNLTTLWAYGVGGMAYDSARERVVKLTCWARFHPNLDAYMYESPRTWEWDGRAWTERTPPVSYTPHVASGMAYDEARGRVVVFGGAPGQGEFGLMAMGETWEWDGNTWDRRMPATSPSPRVSPAMAYDRARQRVVLHGGWADGVVFGDTWEWDGSDWVEVVAGWCDENCPPSPGARVGAAMAYSDVAQRVVLFGGANYWDYLGETWEWDGATWVQRFYADGPPPRRGAGMAYDAGRGRLVLFGGWNWDGHLRRSDTWEWDGNTWSDVTPPADPVRSTSPLFGGAFDSDRGVAVLLAGRGGMDAGAYSELWERDGGLWTERPTEVIPGPRREPCMAYDAVRNRVVLFGGRTDILAPVAETWEWDGSTWEQFTPATSPPSTRCDTSMTFHEERGHVVVVPSSPFNPNIYDPLPPLDIWEWDGATWSLIPVAVRPPGRLEPSVAYDSGRGRLVLFGGDRCIDADGHVFEKSDDTWEWDGSTWELRVPAVRPAPRTKASMVYDPARARIVLWSGHVDAHDPMDGDYGRDTWEWDGVTWENTTSSTDRPVTAPMMYDSARERVLLFDQYFANTWEYGPVDPCAHAVEAMAFSPGDGTDSASAAASLGAPDGQVVALGVDGATVLRMSPPIGDEDGTDLIVYETGARSGEVDERFWVEVSADNVTFSFVRDCRGDPCLVDIARSGLAAAAFVRISDVGPQESGVDPPGLGADIDALAALHCVEVCNGLDDNRDGSIPSDELDQDNDHYVPCQPWLGADPSVLAGGDCNDGASRVYPGAAEICNGVDDDCDGVIDNGDVALCDDGNACTVGDSCRAGACVSGDPLVCHALDQCHAAGICDPATGVCSNPTQPDGAICNDNDLCTTGEACRDGSCVPAFSGLDEPNPRTNGYYKRLCHGPHSGDRLFDADAACVAQVTATFAGISTVADICEVIEPSRPNDDPCGRAEDDLMVLALNICRARVCTAQNIDSQCGGNGSIGQSLAESDAILDSPSRDADTCSHAKCLDEEINTGRALELNSLTLRLEAGNVRFAWEPPYLDDGTGVPRKYRVWRRPLGSLLPFATIGEPTSPAFLDATSGDEAWEYEVTPVMD